ncbi:MAG: VOC family protein [Caulobacteraceae bacterium]
MIDAGAPGLEASTPRPGASDHLALSKFPQGVITFFYYDDLSGAAAFYRDVIGLKSVMVSDWCVIFELNPGARLGLVNATAGSQRPMAGRNKGAILSLQIEDVDACLERLKRLGLAPASAVLAEGCCGRTREIKIHDPEGYTVEFFEWVDQQAAYST